MTYLEKLKLECPEYNNYHPNGLPTTCPHILGYEEGAYCRRGGVANCEYCWNREIPGPMPTYGNVRYMCALTDERDGTACRDEHISETNNEREETKMDQNTKNPVTTRKTKAELLEEINVLKKELEDREKYKQYETAANDIAAMRDAFVNSGFSRDEAFQLTCRIVDQGMKMAKR